MIAISDKRLIEQCKKGKARYQKILYDKFACRVYPVCYRYAKNEEDAKDMSMEDLRDAAEEKTSDAMEGKKVDQDSDGDNDFDDVKIARMIASGMSKKDAIAKVKNARSNYDWLKRNTKKVKGTIVEKPFYDPKKKIASS